MSADVQTPLKDILVYTTLSDTDSVVVLAVAFAAWATLKNTCDDDDDDDTCRITCHPAEAASPGLTPAVVTVEVKDNSQFTPTDATQLDRRDETHRAV